jgi:thiaminase/transcriptional activator TenA
LDTFTRPEGKSIFIFSRHFSLAAPPNQGGHFLFAPPVVNFQIYTTNKEGKELSFCHELRDHAKEIWNGWHEHPFIKGIGAGSLDREKYIYWIKQDYVYLKDYARVFALAGAKAKRLEDMQDFARLMDGVLNTEMNLHRNYCSRFEIDVQELDKLEKSPTCQGYTDFLVRTAAVETVGITLAALLPCFWGFYEIGCRLQEVGNTGPDNLYRDWIVMYSSPDFAHLVEWSKNLMERYAAEAGEAERDGMKEAFLISSKYEAMFWEMAHALEEWKY